MSEAVIDQLYQENKAVLDILDRAGEVTLRVAADTNFRKILVMAAASYFEVAIKDAVIAFVAQGSSNNPWIVAFTQKKGLERQYHTLFQWDGKNANTFFGLFGQDCREDHQSNLKEAAKLDESIRAFLELGSLRNELAHENFGVFALPKTTDEIIELYHRANEFVVYLGSFFGKQLDAIAKQGERRAAESDDSRDSSVPD